METATMQLANLQVLNQLFLSIFMLIPLVLIARTVVTGTNYSPILLVVVFGLAMGYVLVASNVSAPGLPGFEVVELISRTTTIALTVPFFAGGQEMRRMFGKSKHEHEDLVIHSNEEMCIGTNKTQFAYLVRAFFLLLGLETFSRVISGIDSGELSRYYPLLAYIGIAGSIIIIDFKSVVVINKKHYIRKGIIETLGIGVILVVSYFVSVAIRHIIALPQIFFVMLITCGAGAIFYRWRFGPTLRSLMFAGMPLVLTGSFLIGGSRISDAFGIGGMGSVLMFGFFGQLLWMFGGIALLMFFAKTSNVRNLAPGLAGGLSHAGLTGACNAGDFGRIARVRATVMINIPFLAHVFVFSIFALSAREGRLLMAPTITVLCIGIALTMWALLTMRSTETADHPDHKDSKEVKALMKFSMGWQLVAMFGGFFLLSVFNMSLDQTAVAATAALSHFGLFAATQGGMFGTEVADVLPFIFAMPFLVHPFVFFLFGKAMERDGEMPTKPVYALAFIGVAGTVFSLVTI